MTDVFIKMGSLNKDTHGECYIKIKAKIELVLAQAKDLQRLSVNPQKVGEGHEQILFHGPQRETNLLAP